MIGCRSTSRRTSAVSRGFGEATGMRLLYSFPDEIGRPGIGTTALHQVRGLAEEGIDVVLYCTSTRAELPERVKLVTTLALGRRRIPHRAIGVARAYRYHDMRVATAL